MDSRAIKPAVTKKKTINRQLNNMHELVVEVDSTSRTRR
jgi:hypothetical protein